MASECFRCGAAFDPAAVGQWRCQWHPLPCNLVDGAHPCCGFNPIRAAARAAATHLSAYDSALARGYVESDTRGCLIGDHAAATHSAPPWAVVVGAAAVARVPPRALLVQRPADEAVALAPWCVIIADPVTKEGQKHDVSDAVLAALLRFFGAQKTHAARPLMHRALRVVQELAGDDVVPPDDDDVDARLAVHLLASPSALRGVPVAIVRTHAPAVSAATAHRASTLFS
jgi:hypothetical protein